MSVVVRATGRRAELEVGARGSSPSPRNRRVIPKPGASTEAPPRLGRRGRLRVWFAEVRGRFEATLERLRRAAVWAGRAAAVIGAIAASVALFRVLERHVRTSAAFATTAIEVEGEARLGEAEVAALAGLALGRNVFEKAPDDARRALLQSPWVAEAEVRRRLPGTWSLRIRERVPVAVLALEGAWLVADDGVVFKPVEPGDPVDLPVITGLERVRLTSDRAYRTRILLAAVAILAEWRGAGLLRREPLSEIHVESDDALTLRIGDDATEVRLGAGPYRDKLARLRRVLDELGRRHARPAYVYLDNVRRPDRVTVRVR